MRWFVALLCAFVLVVPASADEEALDVVTLYNGHTVQGRVVEDTDQYVVLERVGVSGGVSRFKVARGDVKHVAFGKGRVTGTAVQVPDQVRDAWFLLRSEGRIVGTRHLRMWTLTGDTRGFRMEEETVYFAQGRHVPEIRMRLVEWTDLRLVLTKGLYREVGESAEEMDGPGRYVRSVSGSVEEGIFKAGVTEGGETKQLEVDIPTGTRGRLGLREHILRGERRVGIDTAAFFDVADIALVQVRAGFVSVGEREMCPPAPGRPIAVRRDEMHWEHAGTRLISFFDGGTEPLEESITDSIVAVPATKERASAAVENATTRARDPKAGKIKLPDAGIQFALPDPSWTWKAQTARPTHTGWRVLGMAHAPVYTANVRIELHPEGALLSPGLTNARAWLLERLKSVSSDQTVFDEIQELETVEGGWRIGLTGTLRGDTKVRTLAVVVDRGDTRVLVLVACPERSWTDGGKDAMERFVDSIELL